VSTDRPKDMAASVKARLTDLGRKQGEEFQLVLTLRYWAEMPLEQIAGYLGRPLTTVKWRLHRARSQMRKKIHSRLGDTAPQVFPFMGERCDNMVSRVLAQISRNSPSLT